MKATLNAACIMIGLVLYILSFFEKDKQDKLILIAQAIMVTLVSLLP